MSCRITDPDIRDRSKQINWKQWSFEFVSMPKVIRIFQNTWHWLFNLEWTLFEFKTHFKNSKTNWAGGKSVNWWVSCVKDAFRKRWLINVLCSLFSVDPPCVVSFFPLLTVKVWWNNLHFKIKALYFSCFIKETHWNQT